MKFTALALLLACVLGAASAQTTTYSLMLVGMALEFGAPAIARWTGFLSVWRAGEEQSPPVDTTAYAMCVISFNADSNNITYNLTFNEVLTLIDSFETLPLTMHAQMS